MQTETICRDTHKCAHASPTCAPCPPAVNGGGLCHGSLGCSKKPTLSPALSTFLLCRSSPRNMLPHKNSGKSNSGQTPYRDEGDMDRSFPTGS